MCWGSMKSKRRELSEEDKKYMLQIWLKHPLPVFARFPNAHQALVGCWCGRITAARMVEVISQAPPEYGIPSWFFVDRNSLDCPHE